VHESNGLHLHCGERAHIAVLVVQFVHRLGNSSFMRGRMQCLLLLSLLLTDRIWPLPYKLSYPRPPLLLRAPPVHGV
jgi:hypothetical protein